MRGHCLPAVRPDRTVPQHLEVLNAFVGCFSSRAKRVGEANPVERALEVTSYLGGHGGPARLQHRRHYVDGVVELAPHAARFSGSRGPVHDKRRSRPALVGELFVPAVGRISRHRPARCVAGRGGRPAPLGNSGDLGICAVRHAVFGRHRRTSTERAAFGRSAVVRQDQDEGVVKGLLPAQRLDQPTDLVVCMG